MNFPPAKVHKLERQYLECETFLREKVTEFSFCTDNLLYEKLPLYRFRRCSDGGLFRRAFERAPKPFGARSKRLGSTSQRASEQTDSICRVFYIHFLLLIKQKLNNFMPNLYSRLKKDKISTILIPAMSNRRSK